jgi:DNA-binding NtrC family response regulator
MSNDNTLQNNNDKPLVAGDEEYEVRYIAEKLRVSEKRVREAIHAVGIDRQKVEDYLKGKK